MHSLNSLDPYEEPLRGRIPSPYYYHRQSNDWQKGRSLQGPKRALRLCILCIILPGLLLGVPLYLKHHVFAYQMYPVGMSDMRLIDGKVSTTWCQQQVVRSNATFNAFLLPDAPNVATDRIHVSMIRHLELSDDMKEYWGFYLLKGSTVTVSTCARWPGASMILIRGHKHLQQCAYIGDDSSEELEELLEIAAEKGILDLEISSPESPPNRVDLLTKRRPEVQFHDQFLRDNAENFTFSPLQPLEKDSEDDISGKRMKSLLNLLPHKANKFKANVAYNHTHIGAHVDRLKNQLKIEIENRDRMNKNATNTTLSGTINIKDFIRLQQADHVHKVRETNIGNHETENVKFLKKQDNATDEKSPKSVVATDSESDSGQSEKADANSSEILESILKQLHKLDADKQSQVFSVLKGQNDNKDNDETVGKLKQAVESSTKKAKLKMETSTTKVNQSIEDEVEILDLNEPKMGTYKRERKNKFATTPRPVDRTMEDKISRLRRQLELKTELSSAASEDENLAIEEGYVPDGIADHHHVINQTNMFDRSNSEFWSSFSSSEETLLNCAGLILSLPLSPNKKCEASSDDADFSSASHSNGITYTVPTNGYYFFVFNSENEVQDNYIRVKFNIEKTVYNVSNSISSCNATSECRLPLNFFSNQKVVFELPLNNNETLWNEEYIVISECEPRTVIYLVCVISVPLFILLFAFQ